MLTLIDKLPAIVVLPLLAFFIYIAILGLLMPLFVLSIKSDIRKIAKLLDDFQPELKKYINRPAAYRPIVSHPVGRPRD